MISDPKPKTHRDKKYTDKWIRRQPCALCDNEPIEGFRDIMPMHRRTPDGGGIGKKGHDYNAIPGCAICHNLADLFPRDFDDRLMERKGVTWIECAEEHWERYQDHEEKGKRNSRDTKG